MSSSDLMMSRWSGWKPDQVGPHVANLSIAVLVFDLCHKNFVRSEPSARLMFNSWDVRRVATRKRRLAKRYAFNTGNSHHLTIGQASRDTAACLFYVFLRRMYMYVRISSSLYASVCLYLYVYCCVRILCIYLCIVGINVLRVRNCRMCAFIRACAHRMCESDCMSIFMHARKISVSVL